jgi:hypothetical protein
MKYYFIMRKHFMYPILRERDLEAWNYKPCKCRAPRILSIVQYDRIYNYTNPVRRERPQIAHEVSMFNTLQKARHNGRFYNREIRYRRRHRKECI